MSMESPDPKTEIKFGKYKGQTFVYVYENDPKYVEWVKTLTELKGNMLEFVNFIKEREMCKNSIPSVKYSQHTPTRIPKKTNDSTYGASDLYTPRPLTLESSLYSRGETHSSLKTEFSTKRKRVYDFPTPNDMSFSKDSDYKLEKEFLSPSLQHMLDVLVNDPEDTEKEKVIELEGILALVLFSENEFFLSYTKLKNNTGWWSTYVPPEVLSSLAKMGLEHQTRMLGKEKCVSYKASEYNNVLKALKGLVKDKGDIEPIPNFVLRSFPEFSGYAKEVEAEEKTKLILKREQDEYTKENMSKKESLIGKVLWEKLFSFQKEGVNFGLKKNGRVLIGDEMGLGKSLQALAISAFYQKDWPLLIICPSSLKYQWMEQCVTWLPHLVTEEEILLIKTSKQFSKENMKVNVVRKRRKNTKQEHDESTASEEKYRSEYEGVSRGSESEGKPVKIVIISYDLLARAEESEHFETIICDESHYLKNSSSKRTKKVCPILRSAKRVILLSGTPELNLPTELYEQVSSILPGFSRASVFNERYCKKKYNYFIKKMEYADSKHTQELHQFLTSTVMIRRLKNDVLTQLPPKIRSKIPIEIHERAIRTTKMLLDSNPRSDPVSSEGGAGTVHSLWEEMSKYIRKEDDEGEGSQKYMITKLFMLTGHAKTSGVCRYVEEILENNEKFIIFAHHVFMLDAIEETLRKKKVGYIRIDGTTKMEERSKMVQLFQNSGAETDRGQGEEAHAREGAKSGEAASAPNQQGRYRQQQEDGQSSHRQSKTVRVALLSLTTCGVGLNLTSSSTVIFAELYWVPGVLQQAEDRVHRIGTKFSTININYLIAQNSIDELMWKVINKKYKALTSTLDGTTGNLTISSSSKKK
ncbi:uncharacterized protein TOT_040000054 [Theileria orientalis strain Shintoku]|uniref:Uncharacterized protein n=1 Tax=Theileria orientalis strain Shintoku TaxID=869250 RepID=J4C900_THEOR|nr:uncharacterized protein TOT_040000054 [Theileria orientalis strain Shintoku]BAM41673.1 uncharacterized protein TOT_040000054 [Theileria orientalis strain Shintoku]|eukprot:XP_009691974.1 uncharacterized protein TOT_040000054 [Theileria orientalis strain Shintoku]